MEKSAPGGIVQSAEQPTDDLHKKIREPLRQLGHSGSTIPASEAPAVGGDVKGWAEDISHVAKSALEQAVIGGVTDIRTTESNKPISIARIRAWKSKFLRKKAA